VLGSSVPSPFRAVVEPGDGAVGVRFAGELDLAAVEEAEAVLEQVRGEKPGSMELDLSELTFLDSSGLHLVFKLHRACRDDGCALEIVPGPRSVQRVFGLAGVLEILPFKADSR
jgi:anti-anti-sigma factor